MQFQSSSRYHNNAEKQLPIPAAASLTSGDFQLELESEWRISHMMWPDLGLQIGLYKGQMAHAYTNIYTSWAHVCYICSLCSIARGYLRMHLLYKNGYCQGRQYVDIMLVVKQCRKPPTWIDGLQAPFTENVGIV